HEPNAFRQSVLILAMAAMVMCADGGLVDARIPGGARRRADRRGSEAVREPGAFGGEPISIGRAHELMAIAAELRAKVVAQNPEYVRFRLSVQPQSWRSKGEGSTTGHLSAV